MDKAPSDLREARLEISFEPGFRAYQGLAQKMKVPFCTRVRGRFQNPRQTPVHSKLRLKRFLTRLQNKIGTKDLLGCEISYEKCSENLLIFWGPLCFEQHFNGSLLMGSLRQVLASLGTPNMMEITVPKLRKQGLSLEMRELPMYKLPVILCPNVVGPKRSCKIPTKISARFPCTKKREAHRRASELPNRAI